MGQSPAAVLVTGATAGVAAVSTNQSVWRPTVLLWARSEEAAAVADRARAATAGWAHVHRAIFEPAGASARPL